VKIWHAMEDSHWNATDLEEAAESLRTGGLVAFPTETVYGLGANALMEEAVLRIFEVKNRPADNPLIVHLADTAQLPLVIAPDAEVSPLARHAMEQFWPGPLTLLLPANRQLAPSVHPGLEKVGVRIPQHPVALELLRRADCPVAAPSANQSGKPSPTTAQDVLEDLENRIAGIVDGGPCRVGLESTVVEIFANHAVIYRPGNITREDLEEALQIPVVYAGAANDGQESGTQSPGTKYRHYAPNAKVHVWWGDPGRVLVSMMQFMDHHEDCSIGVISTRNFSGRVKSWTPSPGDVYVEAVSRELYRLMRDFDRQGVKYILVEGVRPTGIGAALMNRLNKASEGRVEEV